MIPDHLIEKAAHAAINTPIYGDEPTRERLADMHPEDAQAWLDTTRAALEAVAGDIFQHGYNLGKTDGLLDRIGIDAPNNPNPYRNERA